MKIKVFGIILILLFCIKCYATEDISQLATAFYSDNNSEKSMEYIHKIPELERSAQNWLILGNIYEEKNDNEKACLMYQKAINKQSDYYKAYYNLANVKYKQKKYYEAINNYKKAIKYNKKNAYIYYNYGCACLKLKKMSQAKSMFEEAILLDNKVPDFHYNMAYVCKQMNKTQLAQNYLDNYNKLIGNKKE